MTDCIDTNGDPVGASDADLRTCDDGSFCYGAQNTTCCQANDGFIIRDNVVLSDRAASSTSASLSAASSTTNATPTSASTTATRTAAVTNQSSTNTQIIVGAAVGGAIVGALLLAGTAVLIRRHRSRSNRGDVSKKQYSVDFEAQATKPSMREKLRETHEQEIYEFESPAVMHELPVTERKPVELSPH